MCAQQAGAGQQQTHVCETIALSTDTMLTTHAITRLATTSSKAQPCSVQHTTHSRCMPHPHVVAHIRLGFTNLGPLWPRHLEKFRQHGVGDVARHLNLVLAGWVGWVWMVCVLNTGMYMAGNCCLSDIVAGGRRRCMYKALLQHA